MQGTSSLFITDPLDELNPEKDTTILWMQEVFSMGGQILQCEMKDLIYKDQETFATFSEIKDPITNPQIGEIVHQAQPLKNIDYVFMRKDPPVDEGLYECVALAFSG
jgi:glutathione synthase